MAFNDELREFLFKYADSINDPASFELFSLPEYLNALEKSRNNVSVWQTFRTFACYDPDILPILKDRLFVRQQPPAVEDGFVFLFYQLSRNLHLTVFVRYSGKRFFLAPYFYYRGAEGLKEMMSFVAANVKHEMSEEALKEQGLGFGGGSR